MLQIKTSKVCTVTHWSQPIKVWKKYNDSDRHVQWLDARLTSSQVCLYHHYDIQIILFLFV